MRYSIILSLLVGLMSVSEAFAQSDTLKVKAIGGSQFEQAAEIIPCASGGYALVGTTGSNETGNTDVLVARLDADLNCLWTRNFGGSDVEWGLSVVEDWSGNLLVAGYTLSFGAGSYDMLVMKINPSGDLLWQHTYGGTDWDFAKKIIAHPQGGFLFCGNTYSAGNGGQDGTILHIDGQGVLLNQWYLGGSENDAVHDLMAVSDGWIGCGFQTIDNVTKSTVWRMDLYGNELWTHMAEDTSGFDREAWAMTADTSFLYITGPVFADGVIHSFEQQLRLDNTVSYEVIELENFDVTYYDCAHFNGEIVYIGSKSLSGIELGRVVRKRNDTFFTGAFEFTGQYRTRFLCAHWEDEALVLCGGFQPDPAENWQALVVKYVSRQLNEIALEPELIPCFAVGVEEEQAIQAGERGYLYDATGQLVRSNYVYQITWVDSSLPEGIYFFQSSNTGRATRVYKR
jgi:hypothetical protein